MGVEGPSWFLIPDRSADGLVGWVLWLEGGQADMKPEERRDNYARDIT